MLWLANKCCALSYLRWFLDGCIGMFGVAALVFTITMFGQKVYTRITPHNLLQPFFDLTKN